MSGRVRSLLGVGAALVAAIVLLVVFTSDHIKDGTDRFTHVRLGSHQLDLESGSYTLWWQTLAHPESIPRPSNFVLSASAAGCGVIAVDDPTPFRGRAGETSARTVWSIGELVVPADCGTVRFTSRVVDDLAPGDLVLSRE
jgi:hypothetical protein